MSKHTPGPWEVHHGNSVRICNGAHSTQEGCRAIGEAEIIGVDREEAEANARLMATAPALLKAVVHLLRRIQESPDLAWYCGLGTETFALMTEAYAAATGRNAEEVREELLANMKPAKPGCRECSHCREMQS